MHGPFTSYLLLPTSYLFSASYLSSPSYFSNISTLTLSTNNGTPAGAGPVVVS